MDIKSVNNKSDSGVNQNNSLERAVHSTQKIEKKEVESFHRSESAQGSAANSYRVDESARRITIFVVDQETGKILQKMSPPEAVRYVRHLNEAIQNMCNEVA